jgi:hypothetical protein
VITRIDELLDYENCYGSGPTDALEMAHELHLAACGAAPPDPVALADRLVSARLNTGWDVFTDGPAKYADVLGPAGLARCAELLEQQKDSKSQGLAELRESLTLRPQRTPACLMAPEGSSASHESRVARDQLGGTVGQRALLSLKC